VTSLVLFTVISISLAKMRVTFFSRLFVGSEFIFPEGICLLVFSIYLSESLSSGFHLLLKFWVVECDYISATNGKTSLASFKFFISTFFGLNAKSLLPVLDALFFNFFRHYSESFSTSLHLFFLFAHLFQSLRCAVFGGVHASDSLKSHHAELFFLCHGKICHILLAFEFLR
jgi:hypothetical protein